MAQENEITAVRLPPDVQKALETLTQELRAKGDPMLAESAVARTLIVEGLRRAGKLGPLAEKERKGK